jgi:hypothetical protein
MAIYVGLLGSQFSFWCSGKGQILYELFVFMEIGMEVTSFIFLSISSSNTEQLHRYDVGIKNTSTVQLSIPQFTPS